MLAIIVAHYHCGPRFGRVVPNLGTPNRYTISTFNVINSGIHLADRHSLPAFNFRFCRVTGTDISEDTDSEHAQSFGFAAPLR